MSLKKYEGLISRMCKELAKLYISKEDARAVVARAMLDISDITFTDRSIETWRNIIIYAIDNSQLLQLIETCQKEHVTSIALLEAVNNFYEQEMEVTEISMPETKNEKALLTQLLENLEASYIGFKAQIHNRNELYERVRNRLKIEELLQYEDFFATYFDEMNRYEMRLHKVIRNHTDYIKANNEQSRVIVNQLKHLDRQIPLFNNLRRHLDLWLHKYETLFVKDPAMCLLYTGVKEKMPFPKGVEEEIKTYLEKQKTR
jgi:hypothetical protein